MEDVARSILVQEATALKPIAFTDMQMDAEHIVIKRECAWNASGIVWGGELGEYFIKTILTLTRY